MARLQFPEGFELGAAASATQIEGVQSDNTWRDWHARGKIRDGSDPCTIVDHAACYRQDAQLMHDMGIRHYRMSVEWARIQPREDFFDEEALRAYRDEIVYLKGLGIRPLVTLHHFTNPMWFEAQGGFENPACVSVFCRYVEHVVRAFGAMVEEYITINEPNVYALNGYLTGDWPPGRRSLAKTLRVLNHLCACHIAAYETIHRVRTQMKLENTRVSFAHHMSHFCPLNPKNPLHRASARLMRTWFQTSLTRAFTTGKHAFPFRGAEKEGLYCDFHALNYYAQNCVGTLRRATRRHAPVNDLGWLIDPEGIAACAREMLQVANLPVYVTENGVCDAQDAYRTRYIYEHLCALLEDGTLPVKRYYYWCFTDNFEWLEGISARFGLVHVADGTKARVVKQSGVFYTQMICAHGVTEQMAAQAQAQRYPQSGGAV